MFKLITSIYITFLLSYFKIQHALGELEKNTIHVLDQTNLELLSNHLALETCDTSFSVAKRINPYRNYENHLTPQKKFSSICLRCATCLAIAQELDGILKVIKVGSLDPNDEIEQIQYSLQEMCKNSFNKFDLRSQNGYNFIMEASESTTHVPSEMDGKWPLKLEEVCHQYVNNINVFKFYGLLLSKPFNIPNFLCRGDGIFRDCSNVNFNTKLNDLENTQGYNGLC